MSMNHGRGSQVRFGATVALVFATGACAPQVCGGDDAAATHDADSATQPRPDAVAADGAPDASSVADVVVEPEDSGAAMMMDASADSGVRTDAGSMGDAMSSGGAVRVSVPCPTTGNIINVAAGSSIASAVGRARAGDIIVVAAGTYTETDLVLPPQVSLRGAGSDRTTIQFSGSLNWWRGRVHLSSSSSTMGGQCISALSLRGRAEDFDGIYIENRTDIRIDDVRISGFFNSGIRILGNARDAVRRVEISRFSVSESSRESASSGQGNIALDGNIRELHIHDGAIAHTSNEPVGPDGDRRSGYGIKARPYYEGSTERIGMIQDASIHDVQFTCKPIGGWAGNLAPNINIEFWRANASNVEIATNRFGCSISLEYNENQPVERTFWVHHNQFNSRTGQSIEAALSSLVVEDNVFDLRENTNLWNVIGEYNNGHTITGQVYRRNRFVMGSGAPSLFVFTAPVRDWTFDNNVLETTGRPVFMELRRANSAGSGNLFVRNNMFGSAGLRERFGYSEGAPTTTPSPLVWTGNTP